MINFLKKKLSLLIIVLFVFFSIQNLTEFNDFGMIDMEENNKEISYLSQIEDGSIIDSKDSFETSIEKAKKYELTKKDS